MRLLAGGHRRPDHRLPAGDVVGTYVIGLVADRWGRRRMLALLALIMAGTGVVFGLVTSYPVLLLAAFFGTLGTTASETAPFLPIDQAMIAQVTLPSDGRPCSPATTWSLTQCSARSAGAGLPGLLTQARSVQQIEHRRRDVNDTDGVANAPALHVRQRRTDDQRTCITDW